MKQMYLINGNSWLKLLQEHGYTWGSIHGDPVGSGTIGESCVDNQHSYCFTLDHTEKVVCWFPLEIYAPDSPTANKEKFDYFVAKCASEEELIKNLAEKEV